LKTAIDFSFARLTMTILDEVTKWVTLAGAVIGGVTGVLTYWTKITEKHDRIKVCFGSLNPPTAPGESLHVLSQSDHRLQLRDYGFIDERGRLLSLPDLWASEFDDERDETSTRGSTTLEKRGDIWEVAYVTLKGRQIGAYAVTVGQTSKSIHLRHEIPIYRRWYLRLKIWKGADWQ